MEGSAIPATEEIDSSPAGRLSKFRQQICAVAVGTAILAGLTGQLPQASAASATPITLQLADQTEASAAGAIVAQTAGLFAQQGLDVRIERVEGRSAIPDTGSGIIVRLQNARDFLIARADGAPSVAIAGNQIESPVMFYFRRDRRIRSAEDLAGKSVGYDSGSDTGLIFEWFLARNPVPRSSMTEKSSSSGAKAILDNSLDVQLGHVGVEDRTLEQSGVAFETLDPRQYGIHALGTVYVTTETGIRQNSDALTGFLRALIAGWDLAFDDVDRTVSLMGSTAQGKEREMLKRAIERQREFLRPGGARFGEVLKNKWSEMYAFMSQRRLIKSPIDLSRATDAKLLAEAYRSRPSSRKIAN